MLERVHHLRDRLLLCWFLSLSWIKTIHNKVKRSILAIVDILKIWATERDY
jgi:hypothetical protein